MFVSFFVDRDNIGLLLCWREVTAFQTIPKYYWEGFRDTYWNILFDILSWPSALSGFKAKISFEINCSSQFIVVTVSFVARLTEKDMELSVEIAVHCWLKKLLKQLALILELEINSLLISNGVITGTFLPLAKVLKIDQYVLTLVLGLTNFVANFLRYSVLVIRIKLESLVVRFPKRTY